MKINRVTIKPRNQHISQTSDLNRNIFRYTGGDLSVIDQEEEFLPNESQIYKDTSSI